MALSRDPVKRARQLANLNPMKKGDKGRNPAGRPKGTLRQIVEELTDTGIDLPARTDLRNAIICCMMGNQQQLTSIATDVTKPMMMRVIARHILSDGGFDAIEKLLDRTVGKMLDITTNGESVKPEPLIVEVIDRTEQIAESDKDSNNQDI